jgi:hypothetical protein
MHASFFATLLLAASVVAPAFASPIGYAVVPLDLAISTKFVRSIHGDSDLVARVDPLAARDPGSNVHRSTTSSDGQEPKPRNDPLYGNNDGW